MNIDEYRSKYEKESLVVFLDILGFKEIVKMGYRRKYLSFYI